ncbi:hypothetical protein ACIBG7_12755 [Nonomuraea sp. NPDC050328]|uniref:hypothetical protein n=1 Tax=Nonomuraea sp. NPDC050328 TaxID=3364361 RepID=UPI00378DA520
MGPFHIEVRRESFFFRGPARVLRVAARDEWAVPLSAAAQAAAAMDQAMDHLGFTEYIAEGGEVSIRPEAQVEDGWLIFRAWTGVAAYPGDTEVNGHDHAEVELLYADVSAIRWILNAMGDDPTPDHWADDPRFPLSEHRLTLTTVTTNPVLDIPETSLGVCSCAAFRTADAVSLPEVAAGWRDHMRSLQSTPSIPA